MKPLLGMLLLALLAQCGNSSSQSEQPTDAPGDEVTALPGENYFSIRTPAGAYEAFFEGKDISLFVPNSSLLGEDKGEKRKYYGPGGELVFEVKQSDDDKFKLRNPDGSLRWKVKIYDDKVKVADNEEMEPAYEVKVYEEGRVKLKMGDEELAEWRPASLAAEYLPLNDSVGVTGLNADGRVRGVLLLNVLSPEEKLIIAAELFARLK